MRAFITDDPVLQEAVLLTLKHLQGMLQEQGYSKASWKPRILPVSEKSSRYQGYFLFPVRDVSEEVVTPNYILRIFFSSDNPFMEMSCFIDPIAPREMWGNMHDLAMFLNSAVEMRTHQYGGEMNFKERFARLGLSWILPIQLVREADFIGLIGAELNLCKRFREAYLVEQTKPGKGSKYFNHRSQRRK
jgi:hypothetical protein